MSSTEDVFQKGGTVYPSRVPELTLAYFWWVCTAHLFIGFVLSYYLRYDYRVVISATMIAENEALFIFTSSSL